MFAFVKRRSALYHSHNKPPGRANREPGGADRPVGSAARRCLTGRVFLFVARNGRQSIASRREPLEKGRRPSQAPQGRKSLSIGTSRNHSCRPFRADLVGFVCLPGARAVRLLTGASSRLICATLKLTLRTYDSPPPPGLSRWNDVFALPRPRLSSLLSRRLRRLRRRCVETKKAPLPW